MHPPSFNILLIFHHGVPAPYKGYTCQLVTPPPSGIGKRLGGRHGNGDGEGARVTSERGRGEEAGRGGESGTAEAEGGKLPV